jgi:trk system potassium uptake protein TrkH
MFLNFKNIINTLGLGLIIEAIFMAFMLPFAVYYNEHLLLDESLAIIITLLFGGFLTFFSYQNKPQTHIILRENFITIVIIWLLLPTFGTLPYLLTGSIPNFTDAFFESVSGFTTTGSSILNNIEALPKSILFWRATTHWMGGMGIIIIVIIIMREMQINGTHLMTTEGSLLGIEKIKPRIIDVAKRLYSIYFILTILEIILLMFGGMTFFDAICHSFATVATGGFSTKNTSIIEMSPYIQYIIIIFMILSGINFTLHYFAFKGKLKNVFKDEEFKVFLIIIFTVSTIITINILPKYTDIELAFRQSLFQVSSIITATGFISDNYELWPNLSHMLIFVIMFIGASVGSTGGGIKVARYIIAFKTLRLRFIQMISPNSVKQIKYNNIKISHRNIESVMAFITIYFIVFIIGTLVMTGDGYDLHTAASSIITTLGCIGPGFNKIGPIYSFADLSDFAKYYLSFNMVLGRLEIFPILILLHPAFRKI